VAAAWVTLTDSRPAAGEFRILTTGYFVNGTAVIRFSHLSSDANDIRKAAKGVTEK